MAITDTPEVDESDVELIRRTRAGDNEAFAKLHLRHEAAAMAVARRMSRSETDADDLVSEGFARVLAALQRGAGPDVAFRPYLLSAIRRLAYDRTNREQREAPVEYDMEGRASGGRDPVVEGFERDTAAAAFASLPERWRMVLWHTEVEGQSATEVGALLGMKPNAVAALAYRAREGLRQAYLSNHATAGVGASLECRAVNDRLAAYIRDGLSPTQQARVRDHLDQCEDCAAAYLELTTVNTSLKGLVGFVVIGPLWAAYAEEAAGFLIPAAATATAAAAAATTTGVTSTAATGTAATGPAVAGAGAAGGGAVSGSGAAGGGSAAAAWWPPKVGPQAVAVVVALVVAIAVGAAVIAGLGGDDEPDAARRVDTAEPAGDPSPARGDGAAPSPARPDDAQEPSSDDPAVSDEEVTPPVPSAPAPDPSPAPSPVAPPETNVTSDPPPAPAAEPATSPASPGPVTPEPTPPTTPPPPPPPPPPPLPSALSAEVSTAGSIVSGRPGVVVLRAINEGEGPGVDVVIEVDLGDLTLRGLPLTPDRSTDRSTSGATDRSTDRAVDRAAPWDCESSGPSALVCRSAEVDPAGSDAFYIPVQAPPVPGSTSVEVSISGAGDPGSSAVSTEIPVQVAGMAARFAAVDRGGISFAGNSLVTCPDADPSCANARSGVGSLLDNGSFVMTTVNQVPEMGALNSSSAAVVLPAGARVMSAQLYWGGNRTGGAGGMPAPQPDRRDSALLRSPDGTVTPVTAERVDDEGTAYQATADVTELVAAGGAGSWTVGDVQIGTGAGTHGGWALAVVYHHDSAPLRSLVLIDGLSRVGSGSAVEFDLGGFVVPAGGASAATLDVLVYEGDAGLAGDQLAVGGTALSNSSNPLGNTFNSSASDLGAARPGMAPDHLNLFGLDIDRFDVSGALAPGSKSVTVEFSTSADVYLPGVVAFVVDQ